LGLGTLTIRSATRAADLTDELLKLLRIEVRPNDTIFERAGQNMSEVIAKGIRGGRIGAASLHALSAFYAAEVDRLLRQTFS
jgi:hypothetical protein